MDHPTGPTAHPTADPTSDAAQLPLALDLDAPIPFRLTARARRRVAPDDLPPLRVVPDVATTRVTPSRAVRDGDTPVDVDGDDPRRARARALVRGGSDVARVADLLGVDEAAVVVWTADLHPRHGSSGGRRAPAVEVPRAPATEPVDEERVAAERRRARHDGAFAAGLALVAAHAETTPHGVVVRVDDHELAARIVTWLLELADVDPVRVRVILVLPSGAPADEARTAFRRRVPLPTDRVQVTRSSADRPGVVVRVADADVAARVRRWSRALAQLLDPSGAGDDAPSAAS